MKLTLLTLIAILCFAQGSDTRSRPANSVFKDASNIEWGSDGIFALGVEQANRPVGGDNIADKTWDIVDENHKPIYPKLLNYSGTVSFGPHPPSFSSGWFGGSLRIYPEVMLVRIWVIGCGTQPWMILNANMNRMIERNDHFIPQQTWDLPPPCTNGTPMQMRVHMDLAGSGKDTAAELELYGRWR